jgi:cob(I)alamin adenosyltransferase
MLARMKIYTRTGDDGRTGVLGPGRVLKSDPRVEAYGAVDELNAALGVVRAHDAGAWLDAEIETLQSLMLHAGAELATTEPAALEKLQRVEDADVERVEQWIDRFEGDLAPLKHFLLPGGTPLAAELHVARTVCRRAERRVVALAAADGADARLIRFLNRVADLLFVLARWCNHRAGVSDSEWRGGGR